MELKPFDMAWLGKRTSVYALITPDIARQLLERNTLNRNKKSLKIQQYSHDMAAGQWHPDSSDLRFDNAGRLMDGQNRLYACIAADVPFATFVRTGLDPEAMPHIDTGASRSAGDVFKMHGVSDYNNVAAAVSLRAKYDSIVADGETIIERRVPLTRQEALDWLAQHPMVEKFSNIANSVYQVAPGVQRSVWIAGFSAAAEVDEELARRTAGQFIAGDLVGPLGALMRYAAGTQTPKQQERAVKLKNAGLRHFTAFVKVWNAIRTGERLDRIVIRDDEPAVPVR